MINWGIIYSSEITPVIQNFSKKLPLKAIIILGIVFFIGLALLLFTSGQLRWIGVILIFLVLFISYMVISNKKRVETKNAHFKSGVILKKFTKQISKKNYSSDFSYTKTIYYVEINVNSAFILTENGQENTLPNKNFKHKYSLDHSLYKQLNISDKIHAVFMPGIDSFIHFVVLPTGKILK